MKREIKFRAWELNKHLGGKMLEPFTLNDVHNRKYVATGFADEIIYMQFTGLKDRNGKEVYEADCVDGKIIRRNNTEVTRGVMEFSDELAKYILKYESKMGQPLNADLFVFHEFEVIGNIYENPELLK